MKEEKAHNNQISLKFAVAGNPVTVDKVNVNQPLMVSVQKALEINGSTRGIDAFDILLDNKQLDISQKVETFNFTAESVIFLSLKTGKGGK